MYKRQRHDFADVGYCSFSPDVATPDDGQGSTIAAPAESSTDEIVFGTGSLPREVLEAVLNTLPVDITFVDAADRVRYFNQSKERIFVRSKAVIGRQVQYCHPQKSLDKVNRILEDFRAGRRDVADFWIRMRGRLILIRYLAVRDKSGQYLGTLEVTQDITDIKNLEGEKRLLDDPTKSPPRL